MKAQTVPLTPPMITDELPVAPVAQHLPSEEGTRNLTLAETLAALRHLQNQDVVLALFHAQSDASVYGRLHAMDPDNLTLEVLDQIELPDEFFAGPLQGLARFADKQLQFETNFLGYAESTSTSLLVKVAVPVDCAYIQRRLAFRLNLLPLQSASCYAPVNGDEVEISIADISLGGVGLLGVVPGLNLRPGLQLKGVRIELAPGCCVIADLEIRSQADYFLKNGIKTIRTGTRFAQLSPTNLQLLTHFIHRASSASTAS